MVSSLTRFGCVTLIIGRRQGKPLRPRIPSRHVIKLQGLQNRSPAERHDAPIVLRPRSFRPMEMSGRGDPAHSPMLIWKRLAARASMGFRIPRVDGIRDALTREMASILRLMNIIRNMITVVHVPIDPKGFRSQFVLGRYLARPATFSDNMLILNRLPRPTTYSVLPSLPENARFCGITGSGIVPMFSPLGVNTSIPAALMA